MNMKLKFECWTLGLKVSIVLAPQNMVSQKLDLEKIKIKNKRSKHVKGKTWCPNHVMF
jgi:hypothetical protein